VRGLRRLIGAAVGVALLAAGCGSSGSATATLPAVATASAMPSTTTPATQTTAMPTQTPIVNTEPTATPTAATATPTASPAPVQSGLYLRFWSVAPIGPENSFGSAPQVISGGRLLTVTYPPVVDPYPLYHQPASRTITAAGLARIEAEARSDGLLGSATTFVCPHGAGDPMMAGTATDHLVLIVGGAKHEMTSACPYQEPAPGAGKPAASTWAAFQRFKKLLADPSSWLGSDVGPAIAYDPDSLAVLAEATDSSGERPSVADWPLAPFASFGVDFAGGRCAVVSGSDAATLLPVVKTAIEATAFVDTDSVYADVVVRAFMPGEPNPCVAP
jgi:hypothetical protein